MWPRNSVVVRYKIISQRCFERCVCSLEFLCLLQSISVSKLNIDYWHKLSQNKTEEEWVRHLTGAVIFVCVRLSWNDNLIQYWLVIRMEDDWEDTNHTISLCVALWCCWSQHIHNINRYQWHVNQLNNVNISYYESLQQVLLHHLFHLINQEFHSVLSRLQSDFTYNFVHWIVFKP